MSSLENTYYYYHYYKNLIIFYGCIIEWSSHRETGFKKKITTFGKKKYLLSFCHMPARNPTMTRTQTLKFQQGDWLLGNTKKVF